jgi:hypothetical protein
MIVNALMFGAGAISQAADTGTAQSATDRHAPGNYVASTSQGPATSATDRHAPGNYYPLK